jgi:hypothetical protein
VPSISFKSGVRVLDVQPQVFEIIKTCAEVYFSFGNSLVVTSVSDGKHRSDSLHYKGRAVDVRISNLGSRTLAETITGRLKNRLGSRFDVVLETDHIHIEYDP